MGVGKSTSQQTSGSQQSASSFNQAQNLQAAQGQQGSQTFVDPSQVPFLNFLRGQGQQVAGQQIGSIGGVASQLSGQLGGIGQGLLGGLQQGSQALAPGAQTSISQLLGITGGADAAALRGAAGGQLAGTDQLQDLAGGGGFGGLQSLLQPGQQVGGQLDALDVAIQRNLASSLGTLGGQATLAGQTGGDRQAFLSSEAAGRAQEQFAGGAAGILASDLAQRRQLGGVAAQQQLGAAQALQGGALGQQGLNVQALQGLLGTQLGGAQAAGGLGLQQQGQQFGAAQAGLGSLSGLFNLGLSPFQAQFSPLQNFAQLLGGPTVLGSSFGQDSSFGFGQSFGGSQSQGTSFGEGSSSAFNISGPSFGETGLFSLG